MRRQVSVTPLVATEPLRPTLDLVGLDATARATFYGGVGDRIGL